MSDPWMKFYPTDWRSDPNLKMCSLSARGLWIEIIAIMHDATPYGHLKIGTVTPTNSQLAMQIGASPDEVEILIAELEAAKVFSRNRVKVIFSRKMVKDSKKRDTARINGSKGGNPNLGKQTTNKALVNQVDKGEVKPQKPEARSQNHIEKRDTSVSTKKPAKRNSQIPENAVITDKQIEYATDRAHSLQEAEAQFAKFKNDAIAKGKKFVNWDRAYLTWLTSEYFRPILSNGGQNNGNGTNNHTSNREAQNTDRLRRVVTAAARGTSTQDWATD